MNKIVSTLIIIVSSIVGVALLSLLFALPLKWAWNYVMPYMFDFKIITWGQAWCLQFIAGLLIKSHVTKHTPSE